MSLSNLATGLRPGVCTSTTRPGSPYTGQVIYETDTGYLRVWDGAAWDYLSKSQDGSTWFNAISGSSSGESSSVNISTKPWNMPWGMVLHTASTATTSFSAATALNVLNASFTVVAGRRYMIHGRVGVQVTGTAATSNVLYVGETTLGNKTLAYDTLAITQYYCQLFQGWLLTDAAAFGVTSSSSSKTLNLYWRCGSSGALNPDPDGIVGSASLPHQLNVMDIGPIP
jgi:hypothetical protein